MKPELLYAVGTLAGWIGWIGLLRAFLVLGRLLMRAPGLDRSRSIQGLGLSFVLAGIGILGSALVPMNLGRPANSGLHIPLIWIVTSFWAWLGAASVFMAIFRLSQSWTGSSFGTSQGERLKAAAAWALAAVLLLGIHVKSEGQFLIIRGALTLSVGSVLGIVILGAAALVLMIATSREAAARQKLKMVSAHLSLMIGSVVFGLPFAWLVITSFKEDTDMSSANGIVWIPKVQETVAYRDPKDPLLEGVFRGSAVQATIIDRNPDGTVKLDIFKPMSLRGNTFTAPLSSMKEVDRQIPIVTGHYRDTTVVAKVVKDLDDGRRTVEVMRPPNLAGQQYTGTPTEFEPVRHVGLRWQNYSEALEFLPPETHYGLVYLRNTLIIVIMSVIGTLLSSSVVAYAFSRLRFPGKNFLFTILLSTMMLPAAVTLLPTFLIFRSVGWIDTLNPLWVPAFVGSAFNIFLLRQFFMGVPMELEDAAKIDGCSYLKSFWSVMLPQIKPALAVIAIWTFMGAWNNFMGPLIYINSPEHMPISYAVQLFQGDRSGEPGLLMAFATLAMLPVLAMFFFAQKVFIEGVTLSGLGGR